LGDDDVIDHIGLSVSDLERSQAFYDAAFLPLGCELLMTVTPEMTGDGSTVLGYGPRGTTPEGLQSGKPSFWVGNTMGHTTPRIHVAFVARTRGAVDAFYVAAMAAGGTDNGPPGPRPIYHPNYYGAFVLDPDGHKIEGVCHAPA